MDFYAVYKNGSYIKILIAGVKNLQADENDTVIHMLDGKQHRITNHSLGFFETHPFFNKIFIRINRSLMERIADIVQFGVECYVVMKDNRKLDTTAKWVRHIAARHSVLITNLFPDFQRAKIHLKAFFIIAHVEIKVWH